MTVTAGQQARWKVPGERTREVALDPGDHCGHSGQIPGPGGSLPGPDAGHPLQGASSDGGTIADPEYAEDR